MHRHVGFYVRFFTYYLVGCVIFDAFIALMLPMGSNMCSALADPYVLQAGRIFVCSFINATYAFWAIVFILFEVQLVRKVHEQALIIEEGEIAQLLRYGKTADFKDYTLKGLGAACSMTGQEANPLTSWISSWVGSSASSASKLPDGKVEDEDKWERERAFDIADSLENGLAREIVTEFMHPLRRASKLWKFHVIRSEVRLGAVISRTPQNLIDSITINPTGKFRFSVTMTADTKIFVKNLPSDIKEKEVKYIFSKYGVVQAADVIMWPGTPTLCPNGNLASVETPLSTRQKVEWQACAFITYSKAEAAGTAVKALNGVYRPRSSSPEPLAVMLARPGALPDPVQSGLPAPQDEQVAVIANVDKVGSNFSSSLPAAATATASYVAEKTRCKLFVGNLHSEIPRERLSQVFGEWGRVVNVHVMTGKSKFGSACAFVEMATPAEAEIALKALHQKYEPRIGSMTAPVTVTYFQSQSSGKAAQALGSSAVPGFSQAGGFSRYTPYQV
ncbi:28 kDa ribonucleoprotein, chloroplastic [Symbiodinium microadriaticum]|uniref:28 kDa ribonucleoprotein, chloroplastic n=1 Tax=Symbiodinium microadriaticum TaxID=2951 RepID=A0A1Q9DTI1_SYMMI|nr:28 kDa ribonucleoprotein, chloroplastic [Symbiodinium microadriaticum]